MPGRTSARPTASPAALPPSRIRSIGGTPVARGVAAAVIAVAALITAANAGPARATDGSPGSPAAATARHTTGR
ncbi:hypothetical protein GCM10011578_027450 [Streptomyces fuscichromogenes]|uniref:Uncharacterized protein n=1 Tax=Streptomyces fuscichromogenes TaxID=1324013 RepID=A0A918CR89_9ACTN|nr:hypothetical protein GCM10011578_027450 [Streptomyces fuscichromogenes]